MNISNVRDWFKSIDSSFTSGGYYVGRLQDTKREKLISFRRGVVPSQQKAIGGIQNTSYSRIACNCIIHWTKDVKETDAKVYAIHETLLAIDHPMIGSHEIVSLTIRNLVDIGADENGIQEYALDFEIMYKR